jgi:hypothetical protein
MQCPTKLFYTGKPEYANRSVEDSFLKSLADGGFQVGALARTYFPEGILVETPNDEVALTVTAEYLQRENVTLFEAAFRHGLFFVRADIVVKTGDRLDLYEVKAKSCDFGDECGFLNKKDPSKIHGDWIEKMRDVAFQKYVLRKIFPDYEIHSHLMLVDKTVVCSTDGLNQKFPLVREEGRRLVRVSEKLEKADLEPQLLRAINVDESCEKSYAESIGENGFEVTVQAFAEAYANDRKLSRDAHAHCKDCEFDLTPGKDIVNQRSGLRECWMESLGWTQEDFQTPSSLSVWFINKNKIVEQGKFRMSEIDEDFLGVKSDGKAGLSRSQRQWMQVSKVNARDANVHCDVDSLRDTIRNWEFPLHFIDFETAKPVIPFLAGHRPYQDIIFQFSHHTIDRDGVVAHKSEFINAVPGSFPNYDFLRALKASLESDGGTIFRYGDYENTMLCSIYSQLKSDGNDIDDRDDLCGFIELVAKPTGKLKDAWIPSDRAMVDQHELVARYHFDPATNGSISLKFVLPAMLNSSEYLKTKYSQPIYGAVGGIKSLNFEDKVWVEYENGRVTDPYKLLPMMFEDESDNDYAAVMEWDRTIKDGGAAMTAYGKLQFENIPPDARAKVESALLKYCELDTLAMVMIYEAWKAEI